MGGGLLTGGMAKAVYAGFRGKLLRGTLRRPVPRGGLDSFGDATSVTVLTWACQGFQEFYTDYFRLHALVPETDVKINLFAQSIASGTVSPLKDDQVNLGGKWWQIRKAQTDPATALWVCQSFEIGAPA